jgi:dephospho-CoA kinase
VKRIAIAGGIGAGKSTVLSDLAKRGFSTIDADDVARDIVAPGTNTLATLVDAFGAGIVRDRALDRQFLAHVVFSRPENLARLNAVTHGPIGMEIRRRMDAATGPAVFVAIPLFRASHREALALDEVWAVLTEPEVALQRLTSLRGMTQSDAQARLAAQDSNEHRTLLADVVVRNDGAPQELVAHVSALLIERGLA